MTTDSFSTQGFNIVAKLGSVEKFSTAKPQVRRVPQGVILVGSVASPYAITFPSMDNDPTGNYKYATYHNNVTNNTDEQCIVGAKLAAQEWGPPGFAGVTTPHQLADIDLGAVPNGCDFLAVQVNLTRTTAPVDSSFAAPIYSTYGWPIEIQEGQWLTLTDGALVVEKFVGFGREFWFEIIAGHAILRRKQSVAPGGFEYGFVSQGAPLANQIGKTNSPSTGGLTAAHANGSGCSTHATLNSTSVYSGQIKIVPCLTV